MVQVAGAKLTISRDQLGRPRPEDGKHAPPSRSESRDITSAPSASIGGTVETDLRGLRVDEALDRLDMALDLAAAQGRDEIRVIHGIGTGALRSAVREHLPRSHYIVECVEAAREDGGAGATRGILKKD
jgi:DNA mismatch repair protein MutS2